MREQQIREEEEKLLRQRESKRRTEKGDLTYPEEFCYYEDYEESDRLQTRRKQRQTEFN